MYNHCASAPLFSINRERKPLSPWANISQSCAELCLHATRRKPTHSVGCWIGVKLLRALTFACLWLNTTVGALNLIVSSESAIYVANPSTSLDHEGSESTSLSIWDMSEEDRWDGVSYVAHTQENIWLCVDVPQMVLKSPFWHEFYPQMNEFLEVEWGIGCQVYSISMRSSLYW